MSGGHASGDGRSNERLGDFQRNLVNHLRAEGIQLAETPTTPETVPSQEPKDPLALTFHLGDAILKIMNDRGLNRAKLAELSGHRRNTIGDLISSAAESEPKTIENVLRVLGVSRAEVEAMVGRMNGTQKVTVMRPPDARERDIDKDPVKREAAEFGLRIAALPDDAKMAIYNVVRAFESALFGRKAK